MFQIRRYVYQDVIRLDDAAKLVDCDYVQVSHDSLIITEVRKTTFKLLWKKQALIPF